MKMNPDADAVFLTVARILRRGVKEEIMNGRDRAGRRRHLDFPVVIIDRDTESGACRGVTVDKMGQIDVFGFGQIG